MANGKPGRPKSSKGKGNTSQTEKKFTELGNKIKELRVEKEMTREELAKEINCNPTYIGSLERGERGGSEEFLLALENFFRLEPKTLTSLRGGKSYSRENAQKPSVIETVPMNEKPAIIPTTSDILVPDFAMSLLNRLTSCDEEYAIQMVNKFCKELDDDLFNRLSKYSLDDFKKLLFEIKSGWIKHKNLNEFSAKDIIQGCLTLDDQKLYFSLEHNEFVLQLKIERRNQQELHLFDQWLGPRSVSYFSNDQLVKNNSLDLDCILWFNTWISMDHMYKYLSNYEVSLHSMEIHDPRLQWFINEQTLGHKFAQ